MVPVGVVPSTLMVTTGTSPRAASSVRTSPGRGTAEQVCEQAPLFVNLTPEIERSVPEHLVDGFALLLAHDLIPRFLGRRVSGAQGWTTYRPRTPPLATARWAWRLGRAVRRRAPVPA